MHLFHIPRAILPNPFDLRSLCPRPLRHRDDGLGKSLALWNQMDT